MAGETNFFLDFQKVNYRFGTNELPVTFQDLSVYIDLFDQVAEYSTFYENYQIQNNERPDTTSYTLYERPDYHWTFFLLNEKLRKSGWPMDNFRLYDQAKAYYPHITAMTTGAVFNQNTNMHRSTTTSSTFIEGKLVWFPQSRVGGVIVKINHDLGQIVVDLRDSDIVPVENKGNFLIAVTEAEYDFLNSANPSSTSLEYAQRLSSITSTNDALEISGPDVFFSYEGEGRPNDGVTPEYDSIHHFQDAEGNYVLPGYYRPNTTTYDGSWALQWDDVSTIQSTTYLERLQQLNEEQRAIQVIRPDAITQVVNEFKSLLKN